jgi:hypothetical protein
MDQITRALLDAVPASTATLRARIAAVRWGPVETLNTITFTFDGKPYIGRMLGRNADLVIGHSSETDQSVALRVLLDGDAKPVA